MPFIRRYRPESLVSERPAASHAIVSAWGNAETLIPSGEYETSLCHRLAQGSQRLSAIRWQLGYRTLRLRWLTTPVGPESVISVTPHSDGSI